MTYSERLRNQAISYLQAVSAREDFTISDLLAATACGSLDETLAFASQQRCTPREILQAQMADALQVLRRRRDQDQIVAEREALAAAHGGRVCERCGGEGGSHSWPGFVCYDCDGRGFTF